MTSISVFCCLKGCLSNGCFDNLRLSPNDSHLSRENPIQLDTAFMGYEVVIVKAGQRVCGAGAALGNAPLVQSKSYFEVKIQQGGTWSVGLATRQTDLSLTQGGLVNIIIVTEDIAVFVGGMDEFSWTLCSDNIIRHNRQELYKLGTASILVSNGTTGKLQSPQEGDVLGISYDHIQLKFYLNGTELEYPVTTVKGTVYPVLYVDDGAILDIILENFNYTPPGGFEKIMLEQSLL